MKAFIQILAIIGLVAIAAIGAAILFDMTANSLTYESAKDSFITAFGGAAFAYLFVKYGELFTRLSQREKLNLDTLVTLEYMLSKHLDLLGLDIDVADKMIKSLRDKRQIHMQEFMLIPAGIISLQNMKNIDFINDAFGYFSDIEKINMDLKVLQKLVGRIMDERFDQNPKILSYPMEIIKEQLAEQDYNLNSAVLIDQLQALKKALKKANEETIGLLGKIYYVRKHRAWWLTTALPSSTSHYDKEKLNKELPTYIAEVRRGQQENIQESKQRSIHGSK
jgi:hypothetical protein